TKSACARPCGCCPRSMRDASIAPGRGPGCVGRPRATSHRGVVMRLFSALLAAIALLAGRVALSAPAHAAFPDRPIHIVIPFGPGGLADITMRHLGEKLTERTGQQVVIENRPSAGGIVAATSVTSAAPGGAHTLFP